MVGLLVDEQLTTSGESVLRRRIDFVRQKKSEKNNSGSSALPEMAVGLRSKFIHVNPKSAAASSANGNNKLNSNTSNGKKKAPSSSSVSSSSVSVTDNGEDEERDDGFRPPLRTLSDPERLKGMIEWKKISHVGCGLMNYGNTCYLNSVLQCLAYCPPLANVLMSQAHSSHCRTKGFCMFCEMEKQIMKMLSKPSGHLKPVHVLGNLKSIAKHFRFGRQEDSHEFLRYVVDGMVTSCLAGLDKSLDIRIKETNLVNQIFGGYLRSQVKCLSCKHESNTFEAMLDISVEIKGCQSVKTALARFVKPDYLSKDNMYKCEKCVKKVAAEKRYNVYKAPNVLTLHLKRFDHFGGFGGKLNKFVQFEEKLDMSPYMCKVSGPVNYNLYAVLVHSGHSCHSGHYYAFIKSSNGRWYEMNDSEVRQVSVNTVKKQQAYMLFYVKDYMPGSDKTALSEKQNPQAVKPSNSSKGANKASGDVSVNGSKTLDSAASVGVKLERKEKVGAAAAPKVIDFDEEKEKALMRDNERKQQTSSENETKKNQRGHGAQYGNINEESDRGDTGLPTKAASKKEKMCNILFSVKKLTDPKILKRKAKACLQVSKVSKKKKVEKPETTVSESLDGIDSFLENKKKVAAQKMADMKKTQTVDIETALKKDIEKTQEKSKSRTESPVKGSVKETKASHKGTSSKWDGKRVHDVVNALRDNKFTAFGKDVSTWDGESRNLNDTTAGLLPARKKRSAYDEEYDQGKVKKAKTEKEHRPKKKFQGNPFQQEYEYKNSKRF
eukprot:Nk52_evm22s294 gene=Nk52_evmTU22s294